MLLIRVLLVDDHPLVREGLAHLIRAAPGMEVCGQAARLAEVPGLVRAQDPDVVVLDLMLGRENALGLLTSLLSEHPHLQVLVLSMHDHRVYADRCLRAGAKGYVRKEDAAERVVEAVQAIARGERYPSAAPTADVQRSAALPLDRLSDREMRVFELIGSGLPTRVIAAELGLSEKTVDSHKANLKRKLGVAHGTQLARIASEWWAHGR